MPGIDVLVGSPGQQLYLAVFVDLTVASHSFDDPESWRCLPRIEDNDIGRRVAFLIEVIVKPGGRH